MTLVQKDHEGYDFYVQSALGDREALYNILPTGSPPPQGGYRNRQYIERIKGVRFPDRYQPTLHGTRELYPEEEKEET